MWSFVYAKAKNVTPAIAAKVQSAGDAWLWCAIDADTKLVPCWPIGPRDTATAHDFVNDLASRLSHRVQLTSDGLKLYLEEVDYAFGGMVDYAMLVKIYGTDPEAEKRYSPRSASRARRTAFREVPIRSTSAPANRKAKSLRPHDESAIHQADKCILKEDRESHGCCRARLFRVQLHQDSPHIARYPGDGRWRHGSALGC